MANEDKTKEAPKRRGRPKLSEVKAKILEAKIEEIKIQVAEDSDPATTLRDEQGRFLPGHVANAGARRSYRNLAVECRAAAEEIQLFNIVKEIADGTRRASREQIQALQMLKDWGWGKTPETHVVGAMDPEQRDALATLSRDQLLGLLDSGNGSPVLEGSAAPVAALPAQVPDTTESTD